MGHYLQAFIAKRLVFATGVGSISTLKTIDLRQGFAMLPNNDSLEEMVACEFAHPADLEPGFEVFEYISGELAQFAVELSVAGPVAYVETEYFGGVGAQCAVAWNGRETVVGPLMTMTRYEAGLIIETTSQAGRIIDEAKFETDRPAPNLSGNAINRALQYLGVLLDDEIDEFDAIELGRFRDLEHLGSNIEEDF